MLDFLKFLLKKGKKKESHLNKKACKNAPSCQSKESVKNAGAESEALKQARCDRIEEACIEAVKRANAAAAEKEEAKKCAQQTEVTTSEIAESKESLPVEETSVAVVEEPVVNNNAEIPCDEIKNAENGKYLIKLSASGIYTFSLKSPKGDTIVSSSDYTLKRSCVSGIQSVRKNGTTEYIEDQTEEKIEKKPNPKYEIYLSENEKYRFRLKAPNGYVILDSQPFVSKKNCLRTIENVRKYCASEDVDEANKTNKTK